MNGKELAEKIRSECKYTGTNRTEYYVYESAINAAVNVIMRELPEPTVVPKKKILKEE